MILNCWIVDDEPLAVSLLESYVKRVPFLNLTGKFSNALSAMQNISKEKVDVLFLDIQMPEVNGMDFAHTISSQTRIIFTTAFSEYAIEGYRVNALDYLLKPFSFEEFVTAAKKALNWFEITKQKVTGEIDKDKDRERENVGIFIKSEYKYLHILYDEIILIEGLKDYVKIHTSTNPNPILSLMSLKQLEEDLPYSNFIRVHRSYIVNIDKISSINKNRILIGKKTIPIGETYKKQFMKIVDKK
ncbi:MAG TPA: LytTR family DNA-binding domain-containing protein [Fermentimonas sp.]|nr:LytTR family DNA-binding domain-containing protein [Fermentimonas sp.]